MNTLEATRHDSEKSHSDRLFTALGTALVFMAAGSIVGAYSAESLNSTFEGILSFDVLETAEKGGLIGAIAGLAVAVVVEFKDSRSTKQEA